MTYFRERLPWRRGECGFTARESEPLPSLHSRINSLFDDLTRRDWMPFGPGHGVQPRMDLVETSEEFRVELELPGVAKDDVQISLEDDLLTIRGEKKVEERSEEDGVHRLERSYGSFERRVGLSSSIDVERAEATFDKGVLMVRLPKKPEEQAKSHTIPVRAQE
jgi:HSP20 family protein